MSDLALYDAELERALAIVTAAHPGLPVIIAAHSTGGLITPLWLQRRRERAGTDAPVAAVALNSPWLDLQGNSIQRGPVTQALRLLAKVKPFGVLRLPPGVYGQTLHVTGTGEWDFDVDLKPLEGFPVTFGWLNAIRRAHARVHKGVQSSLPTLVLRSTATHFSTRYSEVSDHADLVLDTRQIGRWAHSLGSQVTDVPVQDARHDVFLSIPESRRSAYAALGAWLTRHNLTAGQSSRAD